MGIRVLKAPGEVSANVGSWRRDVFFSRSSSAEAPSGVHLVNIFTPGTMGFVAKQIEPGYSRSTRSGSFPTAATESVPNPISHFAAPHEPEVKNSASAQLKNALVRLSHR
jgi:hypothetical protein